MGYFTFICVLILDLHNKHIPIFMLLLFLKAALYSFPLEIES